MTFTSNQDRQHHIAVQSENKISLKTLSDDLKLVQGISNIAFPVYSENNKVIAAINIPYISRTDKAPVSERCNKNTN